MEDIDLELARRGDLLMGGLSRTEQLRSTQYPVVIDLQVQKLSMLRRERMRLETKYGATHARVRQLDGKMAQTSRIVGALQLQQTRVNNPVAMATAGAWLLQGMLINLRGEPVSGLTVSLFDVSGAWVSDLGYHCTGADGILKLLVTNSQVIAAMQNVAVYLTLTNSAQEILYRDTRAIMVTDGGTVRNLVLDDNICPPPVRREVAVDGPRTSSSSSGMSSSSSSGR
jgi:hypothetical protein